MKTVRNHRIPASFASCGKAAVQPKESGGRSRGERGGACAGARGLRSVSRSGRSQAESPHGFVEYGEVGRAESVDGPIPGGHDVPQARGFEAVQHGRIGGRLQKQMHRFASARRGADGEVTVARVKASHASQGHARGVVEQSLRLGTGAAARESWVDHRLDPARGPLLGCPPRQPEPTRRPGLSPRPSGCEGLVVGRQRLVHRHRLAGHMPYGRHQRHPLRRTARTARTVPWRAPGAPPPACGRRARRAPSVLGQQRCLPPKGSLRPAGNSASVAEHLVVDDST